MLAGLPLILPVKNSAPSSPMLKTSSVVSDSHTVKALPVVMVLASTWMLHTLPVVTVRPSRSAPSLVVAAVVTARVAWLTLPVIVIRPSLVMEPIPVMSPPVEMSQSDELTATVSPPSPSITGPL